MTTSVAQVRACFGELMHAFVANFEQQYAVGVTAEPNTPSGAVKARRQEAEVLERFLKENPTAGLLTHLERKAALAHVKYLQSSQVPEYLGGKIEVDAQAARDFQDAIINAGIDLEAATPWGPAVLEQRLLELGFPRALRIAEGEAG